MMLAWRRWAFAVALVLPLLAASGCATRLVQPYDEQLAADTQALFKSGSAMINDGPAKSPRTDADRALIKTRHAQLNKPLSEHSAHFAQFEARYDQLATDVDALILMALSNSQQVGSVGVKLQGKIEALIDQSIPSACPELDAEFDTLSRDLTVRSYVDLKCILVQWKDQHARDDVTAGTGILKRANWEGRRLTLFRAILAISSAEAAKKKPQ